MRLLWRNNCYFLLLYLGAVEAGVEDLNHVGMSALCEDVDLGKKAVKAFLLVDHLLDTHYLDGHLLASGDVDCKFDSTR